jgi:hypothetical protein
VRVIKDESGFHMYFCGYARPRSFAFYHAFSADGIDWQVTPKEPVLTPGGPGSWDEGSLGQMAVLKEGGIFRMWYGGYVHRLQQGRAGYAESSDGIHWTRPKLGFFRFAGKGTNICFPLQAGLNSNEYELPVCIIRDDHAPAQRRYTLFLHTQGPHGFIVDVATSRDGYRFVRAAHNARHYAFDETPRNSTLHGAAVVLQEPHYWWAFVGHHEAEGKGYRMRSTGWVVEPDEGENIGFGLWRSTRVHLEPNPRSWDRGSTHISSVVEVGHEWWVYYASEGSVGLAKVGRHRMYGFEVTSERREGHLTSIGLRPPKGDWSNYHLTLNASGLQGADRIEAELVDARDNETVQGYSLAECVAVQTNGYEIPLKWKGAGKQLPNTTSPLRVRLKMRRTRGNPQVHAVYVCAC